VLDVRALTLSFAIARAQFKLMQPRQPMVSTLRRPRFPWRGIYPAARKFLLVTPFQSYRIILEPRRCKLNRVSLNKI